MYTRFRDPMNVVDNIYYQIYTIFTGNVCTVHTHTHTSYILYGCFRLDGYIIMCVRVHTECTTKIYVEITSKYAGPSRYTPYDYVACVR